MSDTKTQTPSEPTMEEILASIRRIISENDEEQEARKRTEAEGATQLAPSPAQKAASSLNVLELTEMVTEDGAVVSLSNTGEPENIIDVEAQPETVAAVPDIQPDDTPPDDEGGSSDADARNAEMTMDNSKEDAVEFAPNNPSTTPSAGASSPSANDGLVSASTAAAATATFAQLARTLAQEPTVSGSMPLGSGRTLEDLVKEMIRPMLKDWLDNNLPQIVEHAVRRELDRMTRRAEDI